MHSLYALYRLVTSVRARQAWRQLMDEVSTLVPALLSPGRLIREMETMRALQLEAERIETNQPARAGALRREATRLGLR